MRRRTPSTNTVTIYSEKYYARANQVMRHEALSVAQDADVIYAVEQGEIEIPALDKQRRMVCVLRFERIIRSETTMGQPEVDDAVDRHVASTGTPSTRVKGIFSYD